MRYWIVVRLLRVAYWIVSGFPLETRRGWLADAEGDAKRHLIFVTSFNHPKIVSSGEILELGPVVGIPLEDDDEGIVFCEPPLEHEDFCLESSQDEDESYW